MNSGERFETLWTDFLEGELSPTGMAELQSLLREQPHLQAQAAELLQTHRLLSFVLQEGSTADRFVRRTMEQLPQTDTKFREAVLEQVQRAAPQRMPARRRPWHSATAVAAGVLLGIVCTTVVFAYVAPSRPKVMALMQESFETGPAPRVDGVPMEPDRWGGDYSEVCSLIDVRPYRHEFAAGDGIVQLSALFNSAAFAEDRGFECTLTIFALDAEIVNNQSLKIEGTLSGDSLAYSRSSRTALDRDPATWQKVSNELRVPPQTDYLMVRIGMSDVARRKGKQT
jgi:hypothetical protein